MVVMTSREFRENTGLAEQAAKDGPVIITDHGEPAYVLMTAEEFRKTQDQGKMHPPAVDISNGDSPKGATLLELLAMPELADIDDFEFEERKGDWGLRVPDFSDDRR